ncbi:MAG: DUF4832 domain-containing protein [Balneolaceae bacterium]|nr:MAG: DUF4832 domain-containing protein [Balneolaceae bacterium]
MNRYFHASAILVLIPVYLIIWQFQPKINPELVSVSYNATDANFPNPERGFYRFAPGTPDSPPLNADTLRSYRDLGQSLVFRPYLIRDFRESDISQEFLDKMKQDFETLRETGIKTIFKFRYSTAIGQPDATLERVLGHLDQLEPLFREYADVIAVAQGGFIGAWGEWHASTNDLTTTENMRIISHKLMDVLPEDRHIQIRYPAAKMQIYESLEPISDDEAFSGSYKSRTGHHNDCFLASPTDVGTYWVGRFSDDPLFKGVRDTLTIGWQKYYLSLDTRYVPMGGETCNPRPDAGDRYHCETALSELAMMRYSFLNYNYSRRILDTWVEQGCMPEVERRLGYRFAMTSGSYSRTADAGGTFHFNLGLLNEGFAAPYNPRTVQVVLRSVNDASRMVKVNLPVDPRTWQGGDSIRLQYELGIPGNLPAGEYEVLLNLPDPTEALRHRPGFSVRVANDGTWEESTGFNRLEHRLVIRPGSGGVSHEGDLVFEPFVGISAAG